MNASVKVASWLFLLFLAAACLPPAASLGDPTLSGDIPLRRLQREIIRAARSAGGTVGVSAIHIESGRRTALNAGERFPMASTYKIPIAVQLLTRVDQGDLSLDQMVDLKPGNLHPGSGVLSDLFSKPGVALSVRNLLELMLLVSDNSATDLLLPLAGGPEAVTDHLRTLGIRDMGVHRPTINLLADAQGYTLPPEAEWTPELLKRLQEETPLESRRAAAARFAADPRDTTTPEAMGELLERIYRGGILKPQSRASLLDAMERCRTGGARLKGILPGNTTVAHKTGTIAGVTNDVGILTLPDDAGHVVIAVFVKSSEKTLAERERAIAQIARSVYDYFLFTATPQGIGK
jgi:beta-lactamase class A